MDRVMGLTRCKLWWMLSVDLRSRLHDIEAAAARPWVQSMVLHDGWAFIFTTAGEDFDLFFDDALAIFES